nr:hypothetical protein [Tanacetum cinerariifolium]
MINDNEEHSIQYKEYLKNSSNAIAPVLPTEEPEYSLSMGYEHLSTIPKTESDKVIKSSVKNLVQIPSEYEVTSDDESECDVPVKDESSPIFSTLSNPFFDCNDDFTFSDDELLSNENVSMKNFKNTLFDSSPKFNYLEEFSDEIIVNKERIKREHEEYISLMENLLTINSCPRSMENFHANTIIETLPTSTIPIEGSDSLREEIDIFTGMVDLIPSGIESDDYDSERDIHFLEELLVNDSIPLPENESSNFDHHDDTLFPRPPSKPPDVEFFFDFKPNSRELILVVMNNINELNDDKCFDPGGSEIDVFANVKDDDYFPFIFVIRIFLPYLTYPEVSPLLLSTRSEYTIFNPGISIQSQWHLIGMELSCALILLKGQGFPGRNKTPGPWSARIPMWQLFKRLEGLRASRKLKPGALSLYVGNGQRKAIEAIDAFYICLPSGLEIVLNNCHYAPSITRGVIFVSSLYEDGFVNCFVDNTIQVSRNNMVYFSVIPRDGIVEIDLSNSLTNESSIYAVSNKRAKPDLDSALLWHCRLGHITRLVAKGYTQTPGIDYEETFSPVADIRAIRILIAIASYYDYEIWQMDVKTGFLNGYLNEEVYMEQPEGFVNPKYPNRYCMKNSKRGSIPMQEKLKLSKSQCASTPAELKRMQNVPYASAVGDIHWTTVKNILKFLRNTKDMFLVYRGDLKQKLKKSAKQSIFATSSTEADYIAAFDASKEDVWVRKFISGLGVVPIIEKPISMYCDNTGAIAIANESGITKDDNLADPFTKALAFSKHSEHTRNIGMLPASSLMSVSLDIISVGCQKPGHLAARLGCAETKVATWDDLAFKLIILGWNVKHRNFAKP